MSLLDRACALSNTRALFGVLLAGNLVLMSHLVCGVWLWDRETDRGDLSLEPQVTHKCYDIRGNLYAYLDQDYGDEVLIPVIAEHPIFTKDLHAECVPVNPKPKETK